MLSSPDDLTPEYVILAIEWQPQSTGKTYEWGFKVINPTLNAINDGAGKMIYSGINPDPEPGQQKAPQLGLHYPPRR